MVEAGFAGWTDILNTDFTDEGPAGDAGKSIYKGIYEIWNFMQKSEMSEECFCDVTETTRGKI